MFGGTNPLADLDWGGPYPLADLEQGSIFAGAFGPGGPNLTGSKSAGTPRDDVSSYLKYYQLSSEILDYKLILFRSGQFDHDMEKNITVIGMF